MNVGIIIGRIGDVDGVALETEKWIEVLRRIGHEAFVLCGSIKNHPIELDHVQTFRPLSFFSPECEWEQNRAFFFPPDDPDELLTVVHENAQAVATEIFRWILDRKIDVLLSENASALPCHLSMGLGIRLAAESLSIPIVTHDHDFAWERGDRYATPFHEVEELVESTFPLRLPHVKRAVINVAAQVELSERFGEESVVVPNVMDFEREYARKDQYNHDLLPSIGIDDDDIPLFQITRIVKRKGIETAIDLVHRIEDPRVKLVITGSAADDDRKGYFKELVTQIHERQLEDQVHFAYHKILSQREFGVDGRKIYSLEDAYANAVGVTYFSEYEGFGNSFVEAVLARKPVFVNNYEPVYWPDIGSKGFRTVQIEKGELGDEAVAEIDRIIHDAELRREITDHNFVLARKHFSFEVLEEKLQELFSF
ncbi:MAG: glycosyltransferase family 4 protein [Deltaproteobacteria bacterium]|nr:glycosyltransferase family 4 protein [Deltaproteobacteria bacterium]MBW2694859.1 glycosyltransferase family 4 protein [Deltaproteobacteria bacterium]